MTPELETTAQRLMAAAQGGDSSAYAQLLADLLPIARRYARGRLGDQPAVEDVAQEALISLHRARHTYDVRRPFAPWFYAIVASRLIDVVRREQRISRRESSDDTLAEWSGTRRELPARATEVDLDRVRAALASLPARQREVVQALKLGDESVQDVSTRLGMSASAVKVTAHRGYRALRRLLGERK